MRVSSYFVSAAIMLAEQSIALPIGDLPSLPTLGSEFKFVQSLATTLHPLPVVGGLTDKLLEDSNKGALLPSTDLAGEDGLIETNSIRRRHELPLLGTVGSTISSLQGLPLAGKAGSAAPVTQDFTSKLGSLNNALPDMKKVSSETTKTLSISSLPLRGRIASILKRRGASPVIDSSSDAGSTPNFDPINFRNAIPDLKPFTSGLPIPNVIKRDTGLGSLPLIGSLPGASSLPSLPGSGSLPSIPSLPGLASLPSLPFLPGMGSLPSLPTMGSLPIVSSLPVIPTMPSVPRIGSLNSGELPRMSSLGVLF